MKLHALELTGFGPFRETQRVDFDAFDRDGVFLISGRTGTGKSSILDGVSFALYGTVPRYDGSERRLRSDHSHLTDPTEVRLEFSIGDTRWRVTRAPDYDRPAKRGGGLTTEPARAELEEQVDGVWVGRAAKPRDVGLALGDLLGLNAQQFQQVILLAQNQFSRFLLASGDDRQTLLRTLFGTRRFEQYRDDLEQRRRDAQKALDASAEHARTLLALAEAVLVEHDLSGGGEGDDTGDDAGPGDLATRRERLVAAQRRADYRVEQAATLREQADAAHAAALSAHARLVEIAQRGRERDEARSRLAGLDERTDEIAMLRARLDRARAAEALRASLEAIERAESDAATAAADETAAAEAWTAGGGEASVDIGVRIDELTADLARWEAAEAEEQSLVALQSRIDAHTAALADVDALLAALDAQLELVPAEQAALDERIESARILAARGDDLHRRRLELTAQRDAAREAEQLNTRSAAADRASLAASEQASAAAAEVTALLQRRLTGFAGELSAALVTGTPCAVCGSVDHPHPAPAAAAAVTDDDLAVAERSRAQAHEAASAAADAARTAREALAAVQARAGGIDPMSAEAALVEAQTQERAAEAAAVELSDLLAHRTRLDERVQSAGAERSALRERRAAETAARAAAVVEAAHSEQAVALARGAFATVAARRRDTEAIRARARTLHETRVTAAERGRAFAQARTDGDVRLRASGFDTLGDARAALRSADEVTTLDAQLTEHAAAVTATRERLFALELELTGLAEVTGAQVDAAADAAGAADTARTTAIAAQRDAANVATRLRDLAVRADDAYADVAQLAADATLVTRLADTVAGRAPNTMKMDLETFVLAAELEEIVAAANLRLADMSAGRYTLHHSDARAARGRASGLGIEVLDAHTGRLRSPQSLSGGETFLASLALALGLGEVVTSRAGGIRLDTLFVDEGFGSLDPETLELAMRTLDELRAGGRTVGVISHVEAMKEQLPAQLVVEATPHGPSVIRQDAPAEP